MDLREVGAEDRRLLHVDQELRLNGEADAVPRARHFVAGAVSSLSDPGLTADAELVVSELVTNALLHVGPDVLVHVRARGPRGHRGVRLEVHDTTRASPFRAVAGSESMTGRGITMVETLCRAWGVQFTRAGKFVWCELSGTGETPADDWSEVDLDPLPEQWQPDDDGNRSAEPVYTVALGDVPTDLLVAAKDHIDNVVREFTLAAAGATTGVGSRIPAEMARTVETIVHRFGAARSSIKRQAAAAASRGYSRTDLILTLPASAADAGEAYLAALDDADAYARTAQILTLETPPQQRAFRHWYVGSLVRQLRALAGDTQPQLEKTFEAHLLDELYAVAAAQSAAESLASRLSHLQQLTAELTRVSDVDEIADVVVGHAADAFGALFSALYLVEGDTLRALRTRGMRESRVSSWLVIPVTAPVPVCEALLTKAPVTARGAEDLVSRYPVLASPSLKDQSLACVPLLVGDRALGVVALTFPVERDVDDVAEIRFLASLADACAQAVDRVRAVAIAQETNDKLAFLADASAELTASLDYRTTLASIAHLIVPRLADWCSVQTVTDAGIESIAIAHVDPAKVRFAEELESRYPTDPESPTGVPNVVRTGVPELYPVITDDMLAARARDEEHLRITRELGLTSAIVVPLTGHDGTFGAITMVHAESGRHFSQDDLMLAEELANRAALAVDHARQFDRQTGRLAAITMVAEAAQHAILAPVPRQVGSVALAGSYSSAAREALVGGDLYEVVPVPGGVRLIVGDVRGKGLDAVRLATVVLGFFRSAAVEEVTLGGLARQVETRLAPYLADEDFVTALLVEISDGGRCDLVSCGHPVPLLARGGALEEVVVKAAPPLGLGVDPTSTTLRLQDGDRLLLYTDGLIEARDGDGEYVDLLHVAEPLATGSLPMALRRVLHRLRAAAGPDLGDDLALLLAEYRPRPG